MKKEGLCILKNIDGIIKNLEQGTFVIKQGHRIAGINPDGVELELPLTPTMIREKERKLKEQQDALEKGRSNRRLYRQF